MKNKTPWLIALLCTGIGLLILLGLFVYTRTQSAMKQSVSADALLDELSEQLSGLSPEEASEASDLSVSSPEETLPTETGHFAAADQAYSSDSLIEPLSESVEPASEGISRFGLPAVPNSHHFIFVGDSRTVGMGKAEARTGDTCTYIGESGEGYRWFTEVGIDLMDEAIRTWPGSPVIFNLGVNDCDHISAYLEVYHELEMAYPGTDFYYMSVNPVTEDSTHVPMTDILVFNSKLKAEFPQRYIDTCRWMLAQGFEDVDGVHYSGDQYRAIHDYAVLAVLKMQDTEQTESVTEPQT